MPRLLRIANRFNLGGPTYNAAFLSRHLPDEYDTLIVGGIQEDDEASSTFILDDLGLNYRVLQSMRRQVDPLQDRKAYHELRSIISEFKPDIVHTHASKAGALGRRAAYKEGIPAIVHTFHGHVFENYFGKVKSSVFKRIERRLAQRSQAIIAISESQKHDLCHRFMIAEESKVHVVPLGFDLSRFQNCFEDKRHAFRSKYGIDSDVFVVGTVGRLAPIKNQTLFLDVIAELKRSGVRTRGVIVGDGMLKADLELYANDLGLSWGESSSADVLFLSWVKDVENILPGMDVLTLTSHNEGTPVSLIEAQASGVPVVSTNVGGVCDTMVHNETGLLVPPDNVKEFVDALESLRINEEKRMSFGRAGKLFVRERFSYQRLVVDMDKLYKSIL